MSFGLAIGDFLAVGNLAWTLYRQCYLVAKGAPEEFRLLVSELSLLSTSVRMLQEEVQNPESTLVRAGEDRVRMMNEMLKRVEKTLLELEEFSKKYAKILDTSRSKARQRWDKFRWSIDAAEIDVLRNKVSVELFPVVSFCL